MNENKEIVWASSKGKMYAQVISEISLKPKEQKIFEETSNIDSGSYMVKAVLNIIPDRIETKWKKLNVAGVNEEQKRIIIGRVKVIMSNVYVFSDDKEIYMVGRPAKDMQLLNNGYIEIYDYEVKEVNGTVDKFIRIKKYRPIKK
jgi:hypothetical protein